MMIIGELIVFFGFFVWSVDPHRIQAVYGTDITLQSHAPLSCCFYWYKKEQGRREEMQLIDDKKYTGTSSDTLTIKSIGSDDAKKYLVKCYENGQWKKTDHFELNVISTNIRPRTPIHITANKTLKLECYVHGTSGLLWRKDGEKIRQSIDRHDYLEIVNIKRSSTGNYTCETTLDDVTATSYIQVLVRDYPSISTSGDFIQATTGMNLHLYCNHDTYPDPKEMHWMKDGIYIDEQNMNHKYNFNNTQKPNLIILNTNETDTGSYRCCVRNDIGTRCSTDINVVIKDHEGRSSLGVTIGSVSGLLLALVVVVVIVYVTVRRHRQSRLDETATTRKQEERDQNVDFIPETNGDGAVNIKRVTDTGDGLLLGTSETTMVKPKTVKESASFYDNCDKSTLIKVSELKDYIKQEQKIDGFQKQYKNIPYGVQFSTTKAEMTENTLKNRYKLTLPYDHTRVVLESSSSDYINANFVDGFESDRRYIASQGPTKNTINDHWKMIWQYNIRKIVMLTNLMEIGKIKCEMYWPVGREKMKCGDIVLTLLLEKERAAYITREIGVENVKTQEKREVIQYHFTAWPDHGTPDPLYLALFHKHIICDQHNKNNGPILVHCSAGIGRTGTYIGLDALYEEGAITQYVNVVQYVKKMRYSRMNMIQTQEQYECLHFALLERFTLQDTSLRKADFAKVWKDIKADKCPMNHLGLSEEFKMLQEQLEEHQPLQYSDAKSDDNIVKNRSQNVLASDKTRLFLISYEKGRTNYINAVQVPSYTKFKGFLTTQLPLPDTMVDFWTMITDHNSSTVVLLLNNIKEAATEWYNSTRKKSTINHLTADLVYSNSEDNLSSGPFIIKPTRSRSVKHNDIDVKTVLLSQKDDKARPIEIFQCVYKDRPDPSSLCTIVSLISTRIDMSCDPVTIVCSDGAKNIGLFCTFINAVSSMTIDGNADLFQLARLLKLRRHEFFNDLDEYRLCYEAVNLYLESSDVYANC